MLRVKLFVYVLVTLVLSGCTTVYTDDMRLAPGPYTPSKIHNVKVYDPVQKLDVDMQVVVPDAAGEFPVVVFSHGAFCFPQQYANVTDFWVSHGYAVISPNHLDSPNLGKLNPRHIPILLRSRVLEMSLALDSLDAIEAALPEWEGRFDRNRAAVAGHSFGGMIAKVKVGLELLPQNDDLEADYADERFLAAVVMSGVGQMEQMTEDAFDGLTGPLLATGGTLDEGNVGTGQVYPWQWRLSGYTLAPPGDKYYLALDKADHYLGGLICRDNKGGEADPDAAKLVQATQLAFLDAYVRNDTAALKWLRNANYSELSAGRAEFQTK